jgi:hypothetical protein
MRKIVLAVAVSLAVATAAAAQDRASDSPAPEPVSPEPVGHDVVGEIEPAITPDPEGDLLIEAAWPFCGCTRKELEAAIADAVRWKRDFERAEEERQELRLAALTGRESLKYVELLWVKKALVTLDYYDSAALRQKGHDKVILAPELDPLTIAAVKKFQCKRYADPGAAGSNGKACANNRLATGWMTFPEAREAICRAGIEAEDETALRLAEWFAYGLVFNRNLSLSEALIEKLIENLKAHPDHTPAQQQAHFYPESYYSDVADRAGVFKSRLASLIEREEEEIKKRNERARREGLPGDETRPVFEGPLSKDTACKSPLADLR